MTKDLSLLIKRYVIVFQGMIKTMREKMNLNQINFGLPGRFKVYTKSVIINMPECLYDETVLK